MNNGIIGHQTSQQSAGVTTNKQGYLLGRQRKTPGLGGLTRSGHRSLNTTNGWQKRKTAADVTANCPSKQPIAAAHRQMFQTNKSPCPGSSGFGPLSQFQAHGLGPMT